jgi:hypothetical protein
MIEKKLNRTTQCLDIIRVGGTAVTCGDDKGSLNELRNMLSKELLELYLKQPPANPLCHIYICMCPLSEDVTLSELCCWLKVVK